MMKDLFVIVNPMQMPVDTWDLELYAIIIAALNLDKWVTLVL